MYLCLGACSVKQLSALMGSICKLSQDFLAFLLIHSAPWLRVWQLVQNGLTDLGSLCNKEALLCDVIKKRQFVSLFNIVAAEFKGSILLMPKPKTDVFWEVSPPIFCKHLSSPPPEPTVASWILQRSVWYESSSIHNMLKYLLNFVPFKFEYFCQHLVF